MGRSDSSPTFPGPRLPSTTDTCCLEALSLRRPPFQGGGRRPGPGLRWAYAVSFSQELKRSPRFLDSPCVRAPLSDPDGASGPDHSARRFRRRFADSDGPHDWLLRGSMTRLTRPLCTLHCIGRPVQRNTRFRSVVNLTGWDSHPRGCFKGFDVYFIFLLSRLGLAHQPCRVDRGVASPAPLRSGRAQFTHPAPRDHRFASRRCPPPRPRRAGGSGYRRSTRLNFFQVILARCERRPSHFFQRRLAS